MKMTVSELGELKKMMHVREREAIAWMWRKCCEMSIKSEDVHETSLDTFLAEWDTNQSWETYNKMHKLCPKCGEKDVVRGTVGHLKPPDTNICTCICGWSGKVDDLLPRIV